MKINVLFLTAILAACGKAPTKHKVQTPNASESGGEGDTMPGGNQPATRDPTVPSPSDPVAQKKIVEKILAPSATCDESPSSAARPILRLLTRDEYQNTVRDILGVTDDLRSSLPVENSQNGFKNNIDTGTISDAHMNSYLNIAIQISESSATRFPALIGCSESNVNCAKLMVDKLSSKLWRRPLEVDEIKSLNDFISQIPADSNMLMVLLTRLSESVNSRSKELE